MLMDGAVRFFSDSIQSDERRALAAPAMGAGHFDERNRFANKFARQVGNRPLGGWSAIADWRVGKTFATPSAAIKIGMAHVAARRSATYLFSPSGQ
jgi:hypothetical protein